EVRWVLLVPEHRWNAPATADAEQLSDLGAGAGRAREFELPGPVVSVPRRFDEDEVEAVELVRPVRERQRAQRPLIAEALGRELIEDDADFEFGEHRSPPRQRQGGKEFGEHLG